MIELTPEQRQAVEQGEPVRIVDPATHDALVVVRAEVFERMAGVLRPPEHQPPASIDPQLLRSMQAFWRDLPELLKNKRNKGKWAAYRGDEQVVITADDVEAYQECFRRGILREEFYVGRIKPSPDGIPPWGMFQADRSLYEFTNVGEGGDAPDAV
ncbi:MAG TPA: hypothetical protein VKA46_14950 [Gemmataceae bacterium]|nr:hypothetical protein [Gemmataceae bacterium]